MDTWMYGGIQLKSRTGSAELNISLGIECIADVLRRGSPWWFDYSEGKNCDD